MDLNNKQINFKISPRPFIDCDSDDELKRRINLVFSRPELIPLAESTTVRIDHTLDGPFQVPSADQILFNANRLQNLSLAAFYIRYALELALWQRTMREDASLGYFLAIGIIGGLTSENYVDSMLTQEREACHSILPVECPFIFNGFFRNQWLNIFKSKLSTHDEEFIISLLKLQGIEIREQDKINEEMIAEAEGILNQSKKIAAPVEVLLTEGGDDRLKIDKKKRLERLRLQPKTAPLGGHLCFHNCLFNI
jgi:hypothetical protein